MNVIPWSNVSSADKSILPRTFKTDQNLNKFLSFTSNLFFGDPSNTLERTLVLNGAENAVFYEIVLQFITTGMNSVGFLTGGIVNICPQTPKVIFLHNDSDFFSENDDKMKVIHKLQADSPVPIFVITSHHAQTIGTPSTGTSSTGVPTTVVVQIENIDTPVDMVQVANLIISASAEFHRPRNNPRNSLQNSYRNTR